MLPPGCGSGSLRALLLAAAVGASAGLRSPADAMGKLRWMYNRPCAYAENPAEAVLEGLQRSIVGQDAALLNISSAFTAWQADHESGKDTPLVLVFTGGTGVGKTESALVISRALLTGRVAMGGARGKSSPEGELHIYGASYGARGSEEEGGPTPLASRLHEDVSQLLYECHGQGVLILDEMQAVPKSALAELRGLLTDQHAALVHPTAGRLSASRLVIIVISDVGMPEVAQFVTAVHGAGSSLSRPDLAHSRLADKMRVLVDAEFSKGGFELGRLAESVIAFMPFDQTATRLVLHRWLAELRDSSSTVRKYAQALTWTPAVVDMLSTPRFAKYVMEEGEGVASRSACFNETAAQVGSRKRAFASEGRAHAAVLPDGTASGGEEQGDGSLPGVCGERCDLPRVCFLQGGARSVRLGSDRPLRKLTVLLEQLRKEPLVGAALGAVVAAEGGRRGGEEGLLHEPRVLRAWEMSPPCTADAPGRAEGYMVKVASSLSYLNRVLTTAVSGYTGRAEMDAVAEAAPRSPVCGTRDASGMGTPPGTLVPADTLPLARLHLDVSCSAHEADGACGLRGAVVTVARCLGHAEPLDGQGSGGDEGAPHLATWREVCVTHLTLP